MSSNDCEELEEQALSHSSRNAKKKKVICKQQNNTRICFLARLGLDKINIKTSVPLVGQRAH